MAFKLYMNPRTGKTGRYPAPIGEARNWVEVDPLCGCPTKDKAAPKRRSRRPAPSGRSTGTVFPTPETKDD